MATCSRAHLKFGGSIFVSVRSLFYLTLSIFPLTVINSSSCEHYCEIKINTYQSMSHVQECIIQIFSLNIEFGGRETEIQAVKAGEVVVVALSRSH